MQSATITPYHMLDSAISMFIHSEKVDQLTRLLNNNEWIQGHQASEIIKSVYDKVLWLEQFSEMLAKTVLELSKKGLNAELKLSESDHNFTSTICNDISDCLISAYGIKPSVSDIGAVYFAVLFKEVETHTVIATALVDFRPYPDNEFVTRMEAVEKKWQRQSVGTKLFHFIESSIQFVVLLDGFVRLNLSGEDNFVIRAYVDSDAPLWQAEMMEKLGFKEEEASYGDTEFFKIIPIEGVGSACSDELD
jgi:hypothetical protein